MTRGQKADGTTMVTSEATGRAPATNRAGTTGLCLGALVVVLGVHLALIWLLPALPCQDLPQHLAYARILADYSNNSLFQHVFSLPDRSQPYFTLHRILAALSRWIGPLAAVRLIMSIYALALFGSFACLSRVQHGRRAAGEGGRDCHLLLATFLVWNPVVMMGFLSFFVSIPLILLGGALLFGWTEQGRSLRRLAGACAATAGLVSVHPVAAGALVSMAGVHAVANAGRRRWAGAGAVLGTAVLALAVWALLGETGVSEGRWPNPTVVDEARRSALGLEFVTPIFRISWGSPPVKLSYLLWTVLGPYRLRGLVLMLVAASLTALVIITSPHRKRRNGAESSVQGKVFHRSALGFLALAWLAPWGFFVPSELTFLDLRLFTLAVAWLLTLVPPETFVDRRSRIAIVLLALLSTGNFAWRAHGFAGEAEPVFELLEKARPPGRLSSLVHGNRSAWFGKPFRLTHFLPMYYTVLQGGINSQFWGRYTSHLPVGFRPETAPIRPPDWKVAQFQSVQLRDSDFLLLQAPGADAPRTSRDAYRKTLREIRGLVQEVACLRDWCLYRVVTPRHRTRPPHRRGGPGPPPPTPPPRQQDPLDGAMQETEGR